MAHQRPSKYFQKTNLIYLLMITLLCSIFYLLGIWQHSNRPATSTTITGFSSVSRSIPCSNITQQNPDSNKLDFSPHHAAQEQVHTSAIPIRKYFPACDVNYSEYTPCQDRKRSLKFERERLIYLDRHCPGKDEVFKCRIPAPYGYKNPFPWPESRDYAWYANVPHKHLTAEKAVQNWIRVQGDRFKFPGGGTMFPNGADAYIDDIAKLINLKDGSVRTAIDTGCGVASWGAYLFSRDILTMSFAPADNHEAQVQFALERGVPALLGVMASKRLPYPSRAFDMAHCSRCLIPWGQNDGQYLIEIDRILRPGGYWILSGPPINWKIRYSGWERSKDDLNSEQTQLESIAKSLCWKKVAEKMDIAVWQKPTNHIHCKINRKVIKKPHFCQAQDPDQGWYTNLDTCLTPLPDVSNIKEVAGGELAKWPQRLTTTPPRIVSGSVEGITEDIFKQDTQLWKKRVTYYKNVNLQLGQKGRYRNVLDMNAHLGGFAAALVDDPLWVMNVVPFEEKINTLGVIFERGLIGTYQNWCEAMSTYPRTYDFIHANSVFSLYNDRCEMEDILLEMDRILRPEGAIIFRDDVDILLKIKSIANGLKWKANIVEHESNPHSREKYLLVVKLYWTSPNPN